MAAVILPEKFKIKGINDSKKLTPERRRAMTRDALLVFVKADRIRTVVNGDVIGLGDRSLSVLHTPGHASHHVALHDSASGAVFTGEAIGSHLP